LLRSFESEELVEFTRGYSNAIWFRLGSVSIYAGRFEYLIAIPFRKPNMAVEPKTILLVEDNADDEQLTLRAMRQSDIPNIIRVARDGAEAIDQLFGPNAGSRLPDLVLLDLKLPKISGLEVLQRIRSEEKTRGLPIVILTSSDEERDIVESYNLGANSYIRKPVDFDEFIDAVRQLGLYWLSMNRTRRPGGY
jgi:two-component system response regulator